MELLLSLLMLMVGSEVLLLDGEVWRAGLGVRDADEVNGDPPSEVSSGLMWSAGSPEVEPESSCFLKAL